MNRLLQVFLVIAIAIMLRIVINKKSTQDVERTDFQHDDGG